jgi:hypothetical protein
VGIENGYLPLIMDRDDLHHHIKSAAPFGPTTDQRRLTSLLVGACWPGGPEDRLQPVALEWLRHWPPEQLTVELPECSCATGRCVICS